MRVQSILRSFKTARMTLLTSIGPFVAAQLAAKLAQSATAPPAASAAEHTNPQRKLRGSAARPTKR